MNGKILFLIVGLTLFMTIGNCKKNELVVSSADSPYKFLKEKTETRDANYIANLEIFLAIDRNWDQMYKFIKSRNTSHCTFYHAIFVDDEKYAIFSQYPIGAMEYEKEQTKHIIATYWYNSVNGNKEFSYYEKNRWESVGKRRSD